MPVPSSYVDIATLPLTRTITVAEFNVANEFWFRRISTGSNERFLGGYLNANGNADVQVEWYDSTGSIVLTFWDVEVSSAMWDELAAGTYYLKVSRGGGGAISADLTVEFSGGDYVDSISGGSIIINDDVSGFPATVFSPSGEFLGFKDGIPAGEIGAALPTGRSLWHDRYALHGSKLALFDGDMELLLAFDTSPTLGTANSSGTFPLIARSDTGFYVIKRPSPNSIFHVDSEGAVTGPIASITGPIFMSSAGASRDGTILYYTQALLGGAIHRWDLVNNVALADLYAIPGYASGSDTIALTPDSNPGDLLVLNDGSVVTWYRDASAGVQTIFRVSAEGSLLASRALAAGTHVDHLAYARGTTEIVEWLHRGSSVEISQIDHVDIDDLTTASESFSMVHHSGGQSHGTTATEPFAPSSCCTVMVMPGSSPVTPGSESPLLDDSDPCCVEPSSLPPNFCADGPLLGSGNPGQTGLPATGTWTNSLNATGGGSGGGFGSSWSAPDPEIEEGW